MQKFRRIVRKRKTELTAACLLLLLSLAMAFAGSWFYRQYRKQVIQTEESQLLTMAGIIGNNLNTYLDEQLKQIDPVSYTHLLRMLFCGGRGRHSDVQGKAA